jgi:hypothetical protein
MQILKPVILVAVTSVFVLTASSEQTLKKDEVWVCARWQWVSTALEGKVHCIEWAKKDCSERLYKEICKLSG